MSEIKKGDLVKVTITDTVRHIYPDGDFELEHGVILYNATHPDLHTVEKIEPPVEVFKPGDVVRGPKWDRDIRALGRTGWTNLTTGQVVDLDEPLGERFTSERYERVDLS